MPTIISGATSPAARAMARIMPVRMPGAAAGSTTLPDGLELGGAERERALAHDARHRGEALFGGDDHHRHGEQRERQRGPEDAAGAEGRRRQRLGIEQPVDRAADQVDEEAEAEDAEDDRGHAGQVVDRDAHHAHQQPLLGVLAQVERRQHAERRHRERHQEDHHHGAEDRREDAALGVRLARVVGDELPARAQRRARACRSAPSSLGRIARTTSPTGISLRLAVGGLACTSVSASSSSRSCEQARRRAARTRPRARRAAAVELGAARRALSAAGRSCELERRAVAGAAARSRS